jgi:hypothetical protein
VSEVARDVVARYVDSWHTQESAAVIERLHGLSVNAECAAITMAAMAALDVRSGSVAFARPTRSRCKEKVSANGRAPARTLATPCHAEGRGFESHHPLSIPCKCEGAVVRIGHDGCSVAALFDRLSRDCACDLAIHAQPSTLTLSTLATRFPANRRPLLEDPCVVNPPTTREGRLFCKVHRFLQKVIRTALSTSSLRKATRSIVDLHAGVQINGSASGQRRARYAAARDGSSLREWPGDWCFEQRAGAIWVHGGVPVGGKKRRNRLLGGKRVADSRGREAD